MSLRLARKTTEPLGYLADGTAFWAYFGSAGPDDGDGDGDSGQGGEDDGDDDDDSNGSEDDDKIGEDGLTGKGRRAIQAERSSAQKARDRLKPVNALFRKYGVKNAAELEALLEGKGKPKGKSQQDDDDDSFDKDAFQRQAEARAMEKVNTKLVRAGVATVAADLLNDPDDASRYLDLSDYEVDENGNVDRAQIKRDLRALLIDKPYLGKSKRGDGREGGSPDFEGGSRKTSQKTGMNDLIRQQAGIRRSR